MSIDLQIALKAAENWEKRTPEREDALQKIRSGDITGAETPERIQKRLDHLAAMAAAPPPLPQPLGQIIGDTLVNDFSSERIIGFNDLMDIYTLQLALAVSRFVGRVNIRSAANRTVGYGTGFMVSPRLLLTNNHVLPAAADAANSLIEFDYQQDMRGRMLPVRAFRLEPDVFYLTSRQLDFSLVAVHPTSMDNTDLKYFGWLRLIGVEGKILKGDPVNIIQHPDGKPKQIAFRNNHLLDLFDIYGHYETDTRPGSSGSPVLNDQWEVIALHHSGVPRRKDGQLIAKDGSVWKNGMDPNLLDWVANEGIRVSRLVKHLEEQALSGEQKRLRDELLSLEPPYPLELATEFNAATAGGGKPVTIPAVQPAPTSTGGEVTISVPLQITIRLGAPGMAGAVTVQPPGEPAVPTGPTQPVKPEEPEELPDEVREALAELEAAKSRVYYDKRSDRRDCERYYAGIALDPPNDDPAAFFQQLHELLVRTHTTQPRYKPAKHVYPWVDLHKTRRGLKIQSIYSGAEFDAEELILADFHIDQARERMEALQTGEKLFAPLSEAARLDLLEASLPYNCEHVVPQSWFNRKEPMRGDLHHLFALESGCNSFRGNTPYFDFSDFEEVVREECGRLEADKFEPNAGKGAIARAVLYFLLRYPGEINATGAEYTGERLQVLLDWHQANPPDEYEKHRNQAIFQAQGNRNPLIDHPDWCKWIEFERGLG